MLALALALALLRSATAYYWSLTAHFLIS